MPTQDHLQDISPTAHSVNVKKFSMKVLPKKFMHYKPNNGLQRTGNDSAIHLTSSDDTFAEVYLTPPTLFDVQSSGPQPPATDERLTSQPDTEEAS